MNVKYALLEAHMPYSSWVLDGVTTGANGFLKKPRPMNTLMNKIKGDYKLELKCNPKDDDSLTSLLPLHGSHGAFIALFH